VVELNPEESEWLLELQPMEGAEHSRQVCSVWNPDRGFRLRTQGPRGDLSLTTHQLVTAVRGLRGMWYGEPF
jgi:hypothetical protein